MFQLHMCGDTGHSGVVVVDNGDNLDHLGSQMVY